MSESLVLCTGCSRHVRASEATCPFCRSPGAAPLAKLALVAAVALAAAPAAADPPGLAQMLQGPREGMAFPGGQGYGAPPAPRDTLGVPTPTPAPAPVRVEARVEAVTVSRGDARLAEPLRRALTARRASLTACMRVLPPDGRATLNVRFEQAPRGPAVGVRVTSPDASDVARCAERALQRTLTLAPRPRGPAALTVEATVVVALASPAAPAPPARVVGADPPANRCGTSPAGCRVGGTSCGPGMVCQRMGGCRPSSCGCNPQTGVWTCTADCGGGVCMPAQRGATGDGGALHTP